MWRGKKNQNKDRDQICIRVAFAGHFFRCTLLVLGWILLPLELPTFWIYYHHTIVTDYSTL